MQRNHRLIAAFGVTSRTRALSAEWTVIHEETETAGKTYAVALRVWNF